MKINFAEAREISGLTQKQASDFLQVPLRTYQDWEYGKRNCKSSQKMISLLLTFPNLKQFTLDRYNAGEIDQDHLINMTKLEVSLSLLKGVIKDDEFYNCIDFIPDSVLRELSGLALADLIFSLHDELR